jgi:hypothetical protein
MDETIRCSSSVQDSGRAGAATGRPLSRRHQGVIAGRMKKKIAAALIAAEIGRVKKIASDP